MDRRRVLILLGLLWAAWSALAAAPAATTRSIDPAQLQETRKSAQQRRHEARERLRQLRETGPAETRAEAMPASPIRPMASTPTGINPAVDIALANYANSPNLRKFVDSLPGLGAAAANDLGQYVSIASPDPSAYPGSDYYEIGLVRYQERMHRDLPATDLRGYVQLETAANAGASRHVPLRYPDGRPILKNGRQVYAFDDPHYLGPVIVASKGRAVRIKFTNFLPTGPAGDLPLPMDTTVMGDGMGPFGANPPVGGMNYTQNRATLHLHGGLTPWISDGTPHQWTVPEGELTSYPQGASVQNVPDMPDPGPGSLNFYYPNQQSARLMFYHDHAYGITRLNVYAGEAAGYLLTDAVEEDLITGSNVSGGNPARVPILPDLPGYHNGIPLIIQDKTFVSDAGTPPSAGFPPIPLATPTPPTSAVDPLWYVHVPGSRGGNLWLPHEYLPNENIYEPGGFNDMGRWDYAPWMIPPMPALNSTLPSPTIVPEAFMDTALVNGTVFPYVELPPTAVRLRILNACNDRMLNLQLYGADPLHPTEVRMVEAAPDPTYPASWPRDGRPGGVPDPALAGPDFWQIGNEGGFLARVGVLPQQPVDFDYNRRSVTFGGVTSKTLLLPPAVRADVVVDLSRYVDGDRLILYNDAPAPMPLYDTRYDYFTGDPDQSAIGGAPTTQEGFGPNTRTLLQIRIVGTASAPYDLAALQNALPKAYAVAQDRPLVPASGFSQAYNTAYPDVFANSVVESLNVTGAPTNVARVFTELPGFGYTTPPLVSFYGGGAGGGAPTTVARATATLNGLAGVTLVTGGSGYATAPSVSFTGGGGTGATAVATVSGGAVTVITITNPGSNYGTAPLVNLTGGGGTGATAVANVTLGTVGSIVLTNPGSGYVSEPRVYLTGGGGTGAVAAALLNGALVMNGKNLTEGFDMEFGRMNAVLGSTPNPMAPTVGAGPVVGAAFYIDPPTELLDPNQTVLWRLSHIGVDSHAIHFHLFNVQVINRVDWTNTIKPPYAEEIGWKETIRTNPFEDIILALRPSALDMKLPFGIPDSVRVLDPTMPVGATGNFQPVPPPPGVPAVAQITNVLTNFAWEYVWHCHLLGHEENDMMRPIAFKVPSALPTAPVLSAALAGTQATLTWSDATPWNGTGPLSTLGNPRNEIGFRIERATGQNGGFAQVGGALANQTSYVQTGLTPGTVYRYRVSVWNAAGSATSNVATVGSPPPNAPSGLAATVLPGPQIRLSWRDNANDETGFVLERAVGNGAFATLVTLGSSPGVGSTVSSTDPGVANGGSYAYRVKAVNGSLSSSYSNTVNVSLVVPAAPSNVVATAARASVFADTVTLRWTDNSSNETGFTIQRATNPTFTQNVASFPVGANATSFQDNSGLQRGRQFYYRVQSTSSGGASAWVNAAPFPITTP